MFILFFISTFVNKSYFRNHKSPGKVCLKLFIGTLFVVNTFQCSPFITSPTLTPNTYPTYFGTITNKTFYGRNRRKVFLTAKVSSSTIYQINLFVCLSVSTFEILLLKGSSSQSEHSLKLTNQSEDSILSAVSADISCSIKTQ